MWSCKTLKNRSKLWMEGSGETPGEKLEGIGNLKLDEVLSPKFSQAWFLQKRKYLYYFKKYLTLLFQDLKSLLSVIRKLI